MIASAGVYSHSGGFVDGDYVVVFVEDVEGDRFGFGANRRTRLDLDGHEFAARKRWEPLASADH